MFENLLKTLESQGRFHIIRDRNNQTEYLRRWYVAFPDSIQRENKLIPFNSFIHQFMRSDDDVFHTHPWEWFHSTILEGGYWEHTPWGTKWYGPGDQRFVDCKAMRHIDDDPTKPLVPANLHWVEVPEPGKTWTMFTRGPQKDDGFWGFCPDLTTGEVIFHETYLTSFDKNYYNKNDNSTTSMG